MAQDYYQTLGVKTSATDGEIKSAYRKMAMKYHPDRNKGDKGAEAKFKEINEAYETLKDTQKRAAYDRYGHENYKNASSSGRGGGEANYSGGFQGFSDFGFGSNSAFSDIFETIFGNSANNMPNDRGEMRGADLRYETVISLEEAFRGKNIEIKIRTNVKCTDCNGTGSEAGTKPKVCPSCRGSGKMRFSQGFFIVEKTCSSCNGTGYIIENSCKVCRGSGRISKTRTVQATIPAGIEDSTRIRLASEGEAGLRGGAPGDLYIVVTIKQHPLFRREGSTIHCDVPISMVMAAIGGEVEVPTIEGKKTVIKVPAGTQSGNILKLRGKGMSIMRSSTRGDMMVHTRVETPVNLTKLQKDLLKEFDKGNTNSPQSEGFFAKVKEFWQEL